MNRFFGQSKSNAVPKPTLNDTSATLDLRVETVNKQIAAIDQELQAYNRLPPARKASQKSRALALLNKKRMYEKQRATLEGQATNIGTTAFALDNQKTQKEIYAGLRGAHNQMAKGSKDLNINKVEDLMDDLNDQMQDHDEMNDLFSRPVGQDAYLNDADLESELAGLAEEEFGHESTAIYNDFRAPSVPVQPINAGASRIQNNVSVDDYGLPRLPNPGMRN